MEHILTGPYNKPTNNSRRPPRGAYHLFTLSLIQRNGFSRLDMHRLHAVKGDTGNF
ncbi:MAG: hypothetical protein ACMX3H_13890 [Sodalis sp. (in: enterobacteria)]|uniref:hypothetical protein n=1 Tax=Sodalis sp. (in: enterobacteria) TaxID=1898979 RepID=UPI0039E5CE5A